MTNREKAHVLNLPWTAGERPFIAVLMLCLFIVPSVRAQIFSDLYDFSGTSDGGNPFGGVVRDQAGNLYGTAQRGGVGYGVVFKVDTSGNETVLHTFAGPPTDGELPTTGLLRDAVGNLYGTTSYGGANNMGTVFEVSGNNETVLYNFVGGKTDGCDPTGSLIEDALGNLYGTTVLCGGGGLGTGYGTVFKLVPQSGRSWTEAVLHSFSDSETDGAEPEFGSLLLYGGNLYGVTMYGGTYDRGAPFFTAGYGTLYTLSTNGTGFGVLHSFGSNLDGFPMGTPAIDSEGNIYGTSYGCNPANCNSGATGWGAVWEWTSSATYKVLHQFESPGSEGAFPIAGVILDVQGNLYGDTEDGGAYGYGTVFELSPSLSLTLLHSFSGMDGEYPAGGLTPFGVEGGYAEIVACGLYGTVVGGNLDNGVVWALQLPLPQGQYCPFDY